MRFTTKQIRAGVEPDPVTGSILTPIYQSTTYVQPSVDEYLAKGYSYSRSAKRTTRPRWRKVSPNTACSPRPSPVVSSHSPASRTASGRVGASIASGGSSARPSIDRRKRDASVRSVDGHCA